MADLTQPPVEFAVHCWRTSVHANTSDAVVVRAAHQALELVERSGARLPGHPGARGAHSGDPLSVMAERGLIVVHVVLKADNNSLLVGGDHAQPPAESTAAVAIADQLRHHPMLAHPRRTIRFFILASTVG